MPQTRIANILLEFSAPLLLGVLVALVAANVAPDWYHAAAHWLPFGPVSFLGYEVTLHWLVNDVFMVFFFGIAAKEITESCLPGGSLNPPRKAVNPLLATIGGVVGPAAVFFGGLWLFFQLGIYGDSDSWSQLSRGWGVTTATDIALAWLVARAVFGKGHPAVGFLLLLAVADDAIGLVIIAAFYGDPAHPTEPVFLGLVVIGMVLAYIMRRAGLQSWLPYIFVAGPFAWFGLILAHLHPALALVVIVPFLPAPQRDTGIFLSDDEVDVLGDDLAEDLHVEHAPLHQFEHQTKTFVDIGLFFFAFSNAGVTLQEIGPMTWLILAALVVGKTLCVTLLGVLGIRLGFPLPDRMRVLDLAFAGFIAGLGLTVALFIAIAAFPEHPELQGQAKMGALFSGLVGVVAVILGRVFRFGSAAEADEGPASAG